MHVPFSPLGLIVLDLTGNVAGRVEGTYPYDGSTPEFAIVRLASQGLSQTRMVPFAGALVFGDAVQLPYTFAEMRDAPSPDDAHWGVEQAESARAYW